MLVDFNLLVGKIQLVLFDWYKSNGAIDAKMDGIVLKEKLFLKHWVDFLFRKSKSFQILALYLHKSTMWPCMEYCCHYLAWCS